MSPAPACPHPSDITYQQRGRWGGGSSGVVVGRARERSLRHGGGPAWPGSRLGWSLWDARRRCIISASANREIRYREERRSGRWSPWRACVRGVGWTPCSSFSLVLSYQIRIYTTTTQRRASRVSLLFYVLLVAISFITRNKKLRFVLNSCPCCVSNVNCTRVRPCLLVRTRTEEEERVQLGVPQLKPMDVVFGSRRGAPVNLIGAACGVPPPRRTDGRMDTRGRLRGEQRAAGRLAFPSRNNLDGGTRQ